MMIHKVEGLNVESYIISDSVGRKWKIPVKLIAFHRAGYYMNADNISLADSIKETVELFNDDNYEIEDWARNNMDWCDVSSQAHFIDNTTYESMGDIWTNPEETIIL